jgi:hypothetical protein
VLLHSLCHRHTHATLAAAELALDDIGMAALRGHPRLARFAARVAERPRGFGAKTVPCRRR